MIEAIVSKYTCRDITIGLAEFALNIRVGALIVHNDKVLVEYNPRDDKYFLVGGRIRMGEDSKKAVLREVDEEVGVKVRVKNFSFLIENFFDAVNRHFHEFQFIYSLEVTDKEKLASLQLKKGFKSPEGHTLYWVDINDNNELAKIVPNIFKSKEDFYSKEIKHIILNNK